MENKFIMTKEEKELLIKDLCARLPYGVKCQVQEDEYIYIGTLCRIEVDNKNGHLLDFAESISGLDCQVYLSEIKPYLIPMSSMTEEQKEEYSNLLDDILDEFGHPAHFDTIESIDWLYEHHFDIHGLIPLGLAIDCTNLNIY